MSKSSLTKGKGFERELCDYMAEALPGLFIHRSAATQNIVDRSTGFPDLTGLPSLAIEAKRTERFDLNGSLSQAVRNAGPDMPVVVNRRNRQPTGHSTVVLRLDDFLTIYRGYLQQRGSIRLDTQDTPD